MHPDLIFQPMACMFLLSAIVWIIMYARRVSYILRNRINLQTISTPEQLNAAIPANINNSSNNLKNLFELPVIFYALCIVLFITQAVDMFYLIAAWVFVFFRVIHSFIQATVNIVRLRFFAYIISSMSLWFMVVRFAYAVL